MIKDTMSSDKIVKDIKSILNDVFNSSTIEKAVRPEISKESLLEIIKELQEIIIGIVEVEDTEDELSPDVENPDSVGNDLEDSNNMAHTWPVEKMDDDRPVENLNKSVWSGIFIK